MTDNRHRGCNVRPKDPPKPERNKPCACGSGRKFKQCCWLNELQTPEKLAKMEADRAEAFRKIHEEEDRKLRELRESRRFSVRRPVAASAMLALVLGAAMSSASRPK